jgi:hypothetical protein
MLRRMKPTNVRNSFYCRQYKVQRLIIANVTKLPQGMVTLKAHPSMHTVSLEDDFTRFLLNASRPRERNISKKVEVHSGVRKNPVIFQALKVMFEGPCTEAGPSPTLHKEGTQPLRQTYTHTVPQNQANATVIMKYKLSIDGSKKAYPAREPIAASGNSKQVPSCLPIPQIQGKMICFTPPVPAATVMLCSAGLGWVTRHERIIHEGFMRRCP